MEELSFLTPGRTFIIAEAGVNHNADTALAHRLIDCAADAGADAVKFQTWRAEGVATAEATKAEYQLAATGADGNQLDMLRALELRVEAYPALVEHCHERGIMFMSTAHDWEAIEILDGLDVAVFKVGSGDLTNIPFLQHMAAKGRPVILSTGMSNMSEVEEAVEAVRNQGNNQLAILQCTTSYPARFEDINLRAMHTLEAAFNVPIGYSDHTTGIEAALAAVALGARIVEKHFTLDREMPGPDHRASLEPDELIGMVKGIRRIEQGLGNGVKQPVEAENAIKIVARKSIVAAQDIPARTIITREMLTTKRPGSGIQPNQWGNVIGCRTVAAIPRDSLLHWDQMASKPTE